MNDSSHNHTFLSSTGVNPTFVWESSPKKRGTYQIFSLCASTTVICIWSAVHRDIPPRRLTALRSYALQATWVFIAFFLPELIFVFALKQLLDARRMAKKISKNCVPPTTPHRTNRFMFWRKAMDDHAASFEKIVDSEPQNELDQNTRNGCIRPQSQPFTLVHAFYATMGGYVFDVIQPSEDTVDEEDNDSVRAILPANQDQARTRAIITPDGVRFLMEHDPDLIPDLSELSIKSRSKSNGLNKALLVFQLLSFCSSCISRLASHLPLTLLEVVTAAHGFCTLATYAAWWHKPLNIEEPILITGERAQEAFAFLTIVGRGDIDPLKEEARSVSSADCKTDLKSEMASALRAAKRFGISDGELESLSKVSMFHLAPDESISIWESMLDPLGQIFGAVGFNSDNDDDGLWIILTLCSPTVYGLVHLFGWNARFPTTVERILWRIITVSICSCGACASAFGAFLAVLDDVEWQHKASKCFGEIVTTSLAVVVVIIIPPLYLLCTLYLLVESIRQLFYLPPEAFVIASWSNYFPHFS
ncbi:hypothetical protein SCHPADRAFT_999341 [Schizopora paradoxa]|uniref:Uncharacterized protein n=1 Tax=Schizopora paradoxa TaxID=27342 RepID=A0A0H2S114_9AGAM|nr:hypothetical protein SCHPADRAFT_999341 [Schizopora paradoxa]